MKKKTKTKDSSDLRRLVDRLKLKDVPSEARQLCYDIQEIYFFHGSVDDIMDLVRKRMQELEMKEWNL